MSDPVITISDVKAWSHMISSSTNPDSITIRIPVAQEYVNGELNDLYEVATHGKENIYRAAVCRYTFYLLIPELNLIAPEGVGNLQQNTADLIFMDQADKSILRNQVLKEVNGYIADIQNVIEEEGGDLDNDDIDKIGGVTSAFIGGNSIYITDYGTGLRSNDDILRGVEYES